MRMAAPMVLARALLRTALLAAILAVLLPGCGGSGGGEADGADAATAAELVAFERDHQQWRQQRVAELVGEGGWTSLVGLHWLDPGAHYVGSDADNGIRLAVGPEHLGMIELKAGRVRFVPDPAAAPTLDGLPLDKSAELRDDSSPEGPAMLGFDQGRGAVTVLRRGQRVALRVKHVDAPGRIGFRGLDHWAAQPRWRVDGRFVAHPPGRTIAIVNIVGTTDDVPNPGVIEFEHEGVLQRLEALDDGDQSLFVVFADRTNGHGSYGAGRYLDVALPDSEGRVVLDFNRSYNPPCAFTAFATCPLPPPDNRLDIAIDAGEKTYRSAAR